MAFTLRYYQQDAVSAAIEHVKKRLDPCLLECATGSGKSLIVANLAMFFQKAAPKKRVLCIAPSRELVEQNTEKFRAYGYPASIFCASAGYKCLRSQVIFASPQTAIGDVDRIARLGVSAIIIDECFPGETGINTPSGIVRIDSIKKGDVVYCAGGCGIVRSTFSKKSETITIRTKNGKSIRCTPDHPIFTEKGFVAAEKLENGARLFSREDMCTLFEVISAKDDDSKKRAYCCERLGISMEQARMLLSILLEEMEKPNAQYGKQGEDERIIEEDFTFSSNQRWEWMSSECISALSMVCDGPWIDRMGNGAACKDISRSPEWYISELLQGGYRERGSENSNRNRRVKSYECFEERSRFKKGFKTSGAGMDCVSHIERGRHETVYNLRVGGHPSYYANGILVHNCHGMTPTMIELIDRIKEYEENGIKPNEKMRIIGMTATPYRLNTGYIYAIDATTENHIHYDESKAINPFFNRLVYRITAGELVAQGFLTKPTIGETDDQYDTSQLKVDSFGNFSAKSVAATFNGNSKTERIIHKVIAQSSDRKGVMIFASTISHAEEITGYLPFGEWAIVTGKTKKKDRAGIIERFKAQKIKYLVNVAVLCTGFDSPHVDVVAILRATESAGLLSQIIGRGLRLDNGKQDCLVLDYAENIKRHGLESDIFTPDIKTRKSAGDGVEIEVQCPSCGCISMKKRRNDPTYDGLAHNRYGEFLISGTEKAIRFDDENNPIEWEGEPLTMQILDPSNKDEFGQIGFKEITVPAHYSRRCANPEAFVIKGIAQPCAHRYAFKVCPHCFEENDIAARHCVKCKERLVDPNEKLTEKAGFAVIMAEGETKLVNCAGAEYALHVSAGGNKTIKATFKTELGSVTDWCTPKKHWIFNRIVRANGRIPEFFNDLKDCEQFKIAPKTVRIKKHTKDGFTRFEVKEVNF